MFTSYLIIALSVISLVFGLPTGSSMLAEDLVRPAASADPGTLRGRHYTLLGHRAASHDAPVEPAAAVDSGNSAPSTLAHPGPFPKYVADRSDHSWMHLARRAGTYADDYVDANADADAAPRMAMEPNYVSHVGPFAYNAAPLPPLESSSSSSILAPTSTSALVVAPAVATNTSRMSYAEATETAKVVKAKAKAKAKAHGKAGKATGGSS